MTAIMRRPAVWVLAAVAALALVAPGADGVRCGDSYFPAHATTGGQP